MRYTGQPHHNTGNNDGWLLGLNIHRNNMADNKWVKNWLHSKLFLMKHTGQPQHSTGNKGGWLTVGAKQSQKPHTVYYRQGRGAGGLPMNSSFLALWPAKTGKDDHHQNNRYWGGGEFGSTKQLVCFATSFFDSCGELSHRAQKRTEAKDCPARSTRAQLHLLVHRALVLPCSQSSCAPMFTELLCSHVHRALVLPCSQSSCAPMFTELLCSHVHRALVLPCSQSSCAPMFTELLCSHVHRALVLPCSQSSCAPTTAVDNVNTQGE